MLEIQSISSAVLKMSTGDSQLFLLADLWVH